MIRRGALVLAAAAVLAVAGASSSSAGPLAGKRSVVVTVRNDSTGDKQRITFTMADTDRLYVTRVEAEVVHTADGSSYEVAYPSGYRFGNVTVSRVQS